MYSQSNEDNILRAIFGKYSTGKFVEFGAGSGTQNNTGALLERGWNGVWYECAKKRFDWACKRWKRYIDTGQLVVIRKLVTPEKVNLYIHDPLDFLSIDVDGEDYAIWAAITARPRVVCIECDPINGTSFEKMRELARAKGYSLGTISSNAVNAFFIRNPEPDP